MPFGQRGAAGGGLSNYRYRAVSLEPQQLPSTSGGVVIEYEIEKDAFGIVVTGGEVEFLFGGTYLISSRLSLDVAGFTGGVETWVEYFDGVTWSAVADSGQVKEFDALNEGAIYYNSGFTLLSGNKLRLKARSSTSTVSLLPSILDNGVNSPSATLSIVRA